MKIIPKIIPTQQLDNTLPAELQGASFAILDPRNNYHNVQTMAEIYSAINGNDKTKPVIDLVAFRPDRLLCHNIIIELITSIKMNNLEEDFTDKFKAVKEAINIDDFVKQGNELRENNIRQIEEISQNLALAPKSEAKSAYLATQINKDYVPGRFVDGSSAEEMKIITAADKLTNKQLNERAKALVCETINQQVSFSKLEFLTEHLAAERITLSVNGAIASGKGSSERILRNYAEEALGQPWNDFAKINGDSIKLILNSQDGMSRATKEVFSQLVQDEVIYLGTAINNRLNEKLVEHGQAPNVFLDKSMINPPGVDIATYGAGRVQGIVVSLDVQEAYDRSMDRGTKTGRFEDTKNILDAHAAIADIFTKFLIDNKGKDICYSVYDNNVELGEQPNIIASFDLKKGTYKIIDQTKFKRFLNKSNLDVANSISTGAIQEKSLLQVDRELVFMSKLSQASYLLESSRAAVEKTSSSVIKDATSKEVISQITRLDERVKADELTRK